MNKTEILNIVNEPSKHIQIVKIDGKDSIAYSSKFVELLELIPTMLTKDELVGMLTVIQLEIEELDTPNNGSAYMDCVEIIQQKINELNAEKEQNSDL